MSQTILSDSFAREFSAFSGLLSGASSGQVRHFQLRLANCPDVLINHALLVSSGSLKADTFKFSLLPTGNTDPFLSRELTSPLHLEAGYTSEEEGFSNGPLWTSLITGEADTVNFNPVQNQTIFSGRDLSARLIDTPLSGSLVNQTVSEIAENLAAAHGLIPQVAPNPTPAGSFYQIDRVLTAADGYSPFLSQWDLLSELASLLNFHLSVKGRTLHFAPPDPGSALIFPVRCDKNSGGNVLNLTLKKNIPATDAAVTVKSWNSRDKKAYEYRASFSENTGAGKHYRFLHPDLHPDEVRKIAHGKLKHITKHALTLQVEIPGELDLSPGDILALSGLSADYNRSYVIDKITRKFSAKQGFTEIIEAHLPPPDENVPTLL